MWFNSWWKIDLYTKTNHFLVLNHIFKTFKRFLYRFAKWVMLFDLLWLQILSLNGAQIGMISKQGLGLSHETSNEADNFCINFSMNLDVLLKATIIAACIFIVILEFLSFKVTFWIFDPYLTLICCFVFFCRIPCFLNVRRITTELLESLFCRSFLNRPIQTLFYRINSCLSQNKTTYFLKHSIQIEKPGCHQSKQWK